MREDRDSTQEREYARAWFGAVLTFSGGKFCIDCVHERERERERFLKLKFYVRYAVVANSPLTLFVRTVYRNEHTGVFKICIDLVLIY